jgi:hypothetical protein
MENFSINDLYEKVFLEQRGQPFTVEPYEKLVHDAPFGAIAPVVASDSTHTQIRKALNRNAYAPVAFDGKTGRYALPNEPTMSLSFKHTVVETPLIGKLAPVLEVAGSSLEIQLRGILIGNGRPETDIQDIWKLWKAGEPVLIVSAMTAICSIHKVLISDFKLLEMVGVKNAQAYELTLKQYQDYELTII